MPLISVQGNRIKEVFYEFEASVVYIVSSRETLSKKQAVNLTTKVRNPSPSNDRSIGVKKCGILRKSTLLLVSRQSGGKPGCDGSRL